MRFAKHSLLRLVWLIGVLCTAGSLRAQVSWAVSTESGIRGNPPDLSEKYAIHGSMDGVVKVQNTFDEMQSLFTLRLRPEVSDARQNLIAFRYRVEAQLERRWDNLQGGINLYSQKNALFTKANTLRNEVFFLRMPFVFLPDEPLSWKVAPGFASQTVKTDLRKETETLFLDATMVFKMDEAMNGLLGGYAERFLVQNDDAYYSFSEKVKNKGYRAGLHAGIEYNGDFMGGLDYRLLVHNSDVTIPGSVENNVHVFLGVMLSDNTSLLVLYDFSRTNYRLDGGVKNEAVLYVPFEKENRLHVKTGFDINENIEIYLSYMYRKENLTFDRTVFDGGSCVVGCTYTVE